MGADERSLLQDGDPTTKKGVLFGTSESTNLGRRLALEGDFATCLECGVGGPVFNDCDPRWTDNGKSVLVEGARVYCGCTEKPRVIATQNSMTTEVVKGEKRGVPPRPAPTAGTAEQGTTPVSAKFLTNVSSENLSPERATSICSNMSDAEFYATMRKLQDKAVSLLGDRLTELGRWGRADQAKVALWLGDAGGETRQRLRDGMARIREIMRGLTDRNYQRYSPEALARVGCVPRAKAGALPATASVCKPDGTYTIFIGEIFCGLEAEANRYDGIPRQKESKLIVLIHEISHFPAAMDTRDDWYSMRGAKARAEARDRFCIEQADNIAYYVANVPNWDLPDSPAWRP